MTTALDKPGLGEGVYTFGEAARILRGTNKHVTVKQLHYWLNTGLVPAYREQDGEPVLNFDDLISLELVRRLQVEGASLQGIRRVEKGLREAHPALSRPFAYEVFFTDGANVWAEVNGEDGRIVIELLGKHRHQYAWRDAIATFARDIHFDGPDAHAARWSLSPWVEVNPRLQFGSPVVTGSRVPVRTIEANLEVGTPKQVAEWYGLRLEQVEGVRDYLAIR